MYAQLIIQRSILPNHQFSRILLRPNSLPWYLTIFLPVTSPLSNLGLPLSPADSIITTTTGESSLPNRHCPRIGVICVLKLEHTLYYA